LTQGLTVVFVELFVIGKTGLKLNTHPQENTSHDSAVKWNVV
jgi:hypothetical protein